MAINLSDSIRVGQQKPIDDKYYNGLNPYVSTTEANSLLLSAIRYKGLTVNINNVEYWYKTGITDGDLIAKSGGGGTWGSITGTLSAQTDLQSALDAKQNSLNGTGFIKAVGTNISYDNTTYFPQPTGTTSQYIRGDGSLNTFPTITNGTVTSVGTVGLISGGTITSSGTITTSMATNKLVGRSTTGVGIMEEITIGSGLSLSGNTLINTATPTPLGYYGAFQDVTIQTLTAINTPYAMKLGVTDLSNQVTVVSDGTNLTRITIANTGIYNLQFSAQLDRTNSGNDTVDIWLRKNGIDVDGSGGKLILAGGAVSSAILATWNYLLDVTGGDYYQLMWSGTDTHIRLLYAPAQTTPFAHPVIPSLIVTVTQQAGIMAGTGLTAINSLTGAVQTLTTGTTGTDFAIVDSGTDHKFNLPSASATNRGALSSTDWSTFNNKQPTITGAATTITTSNLTASRVLVSDASGKVAANTVTTTTLGYLDATSSIQTQLNSKQATLTNPITGTGTPNRIPKFTGASALGDSQIFDNGTNVGIGVTSILSKFHVAPITNTFNQSGGITISATNGAWPYQILLKSDAVGGSRLSIGRSDDVPEVLTILGSGNVGIGTTSPTDGKLQVAGSSQLANTIAQTYFGVGAAATKVTSNGSYAIGLDAADGSTERMRITSGGNVGIGNLATGTEKLQVTGTGVFSSTLQATRIGLGAAPNAASYINVIANTTTVAQLYLPPSAVDYTGTVSGMLWNNASEWKFYDSTLSTVNRFIKLNGNTSLANSNPLNVVTSTGVGGNLGTLKAELSFSRFPTAVSYTILLTDVGFGWVIGVTSTAAARTITLPLANAVPAGWQTTIKDESGGALTNNITIARAGSDTIDGATSNVINLNYGSITVYSDGVSKWFVIASV